jgi:CheY-like chemotaxis protein
VSDLPPIVVVDDDAGSCLLMTRLLGRLGLCNPVVVAGSVAAATDLVRGLPRLPVLVLLDLGLPDGSGFDVLRSLGRDALGNAGIVVLTGSDDLADVDTAYALGAHSYLVKPVAYEALGDVVHRLGLPWALLDACGEDLS